MYKKQCMWMTMEGIPFNLRLGWIYTYKIKIGFLKNK